jgi:uncharacterized integral membrane protein
MARRWDRDDWLVLAVMLLILLVVVLLSWNDDPVKWTRENWR